MIRWARRSGAAIAAISGVLLAMPAVSTAAVGNNPVVGGVPSAADSDFTVSVSGCDGATSAQATGVRINEATVPYGPGDPSPVALTLDVAGSATFSSGGPGGTFSIFTGSALGPFRLTVSCSYGETTNSTTSDVTLLPPASIPTPVGTATVSPATLNPGDSPTSIAFDAAATDKLGDGLATGVFLYPGRKYLGDVAFAPGDKTTVLGVDQLPMPDVAPGSYQLVFQQFGNYVTAPVTIGSSGTAGVFSPLSPARLADTRNPNATVDGQVSGGGPVAANTSLVVPVAGRGGVPGGATAAALNVTIVDPAGLGYATVYPCGEPVPNASNLNFVAGETVPNAVVAKLNGAGQACVFTSVDAHVIVDVDATAPSADLVPLSPARLADTRNPNATIDGQSSGGGPVGAGQTLAVQVTGRGGVPGGATAAVLNVTVVDPADAGYVTVFPCDQALPNASNLNFVAGETVANNAVAKLSASGSICVFTSVAAQLIVDTNGAINGGGSFTPITPARFADTRNPNATIDGQSSGGGPVAPNGVLPIQIAGRGGIPAGVSVAILNVTIVDASGQGYATVYPCDELLPNASNLNYVAGQTVPNAVVAKLGAMGKACVYTYAGAQVIVDVNGYVP